jgi:hypothetical protein
MEAVIEERPSTKALVTILLVLSGIEFAMGVASLFAVSASRPSGFLPHKGAAIYDLHAALGLPLIIGTGMLVLRNRRARFDGDRKLVLPAWLAGIGIGVAAVGGLLTAAHPARLAGMALMFVGPMIAAFGYLIPILDSTTVRTGAVDTLDEEPGSSSLRGQA